MRSKCIAPGHFELSASGSVRGYPPIFDVSFTRKSHPNETTHICIGAQGILSTVASWLARHGLWTYRIIIDAPGYQIVGATARQDTKCHFELD